MYYFLDKDKTIIGSGPDVHCIYESVPADVIDKISKEDVSLMGYVFKDGKLEKSACMLQQELLRKKQEKREARNKKLLDLIVTTKSGKKFNADEASQQRLLMALSAAEISKKTSIKWKLADNSVADVAVAELREAIVMAVSKTSKLFCGG